MTTNSAVLALNISLFHISCSHYAIITLHHMCLRGSATPLCLLFKVALRAFQQESELKWKWVRRFISDTFPLVIVQIHKHQPEASRVQSLFSFHCDRQAAADVCTCAHLSCRSLPQFLSTTVIVLIHHRHHVVRFGTLVFLKICLFI